MSLPDLLDRWCTRAGFPRERGRATRLAEALSGADCPTTRKTTRNWFNAVCPPESRRVPALVKVLSLSAEEELELYQFSSGARALTGAPASTEAA